MNYETHMAEAQRLVGEAKGLLGQYDETGDMPEDVATKFDHLMAQAEEQKARAEKVKRLMAMDDEIKAAAPLRKPAEVREEPEGFKSFGEQLQAIARSSMPGYAIDRRLLQQKAISGLSETVNADGGFLVQPTYAAELWKRTYDTGILLSRTTNIPLGPNSNRLKLNAIAETSRVAGSRWGGIRGYWAAEGAEKTASDPSFRQMTLELKKLVGLCYATDELLADARSLERVISQGFAEEFGFMVDDAIVNGTGAGQPLGIMNSGAVVAVAKETGQAAATVVYENIVKMWARMWAPSRRNAVWLINQDIEPQLLSMSLSVGTGGAPAYLPANGLAASPYGTLMGRPVLPIEQCQTLGTVGDILLVDLSQYVTIMKDGLQSDMSMHVRFIYDEMTFRFVMRVDGQPVWNAALTPFKGSNTLSPFVALATRS